MTNYLGRFSVEPTVPIPAPYDRQIHYCQSKPSSISPSVASHTSELKQDEFAVEESDDDSLKSYEKEDAGRAVGKRQMSVLIFLRDSRIYIRVLAILIMITSFSLILGAVIKYAQARRVSGHPLDAIPKPPLGITDYPCRVFTGIAGMNLAFSIIIISLSCVSSKFKKSANALNGAFAILSAIGFASSMGACFFLKSRVSFQSDLWKWSCDNQKNGVSSSALDFNAICHVVDYGWKFGLVQATLELLTFILSITAFIILKHSYLVRYGVMGKLF